MNLKEVGDYKETMVKGETCEFAITNFNRYYTM